MFGLGYGELALCGFFATILFGNKLPTVARSLGSTIVEFKKGITGGKEELDEVKNGLNTELREIESEARNLKNF